MVIHIDKDLYPRIAVLKAAYKFTDSSYILIEQDENDYIVHFEMKDGTDQDLSGEFKNELLAQVLRTKVFEMTEDVRKMVTVRALASTIVGEQTKVEQSPIVVDRDDVLSDWFDK